jgi:hypothetical protein
MNWLQLDNANSAWVKAGIFSKKTAPVFKQRRLTETKEPINYCLLIF